MNHSETIGKLATALIAAQKELVPLPKDKQNPFFHSAYVGLETVMPAALRLLNAHGLGLVQTVGADSGTTLTTMLIHESGEWLSDTQPLLLVKPDPQGQGSAITYARRYGLMAMLGMVADEDDDANAASPPKRPAAAPQPRSAPAKQEGRPMPPQGQAGPRRMALKRAGTCSNCDYEMLPGTDAFWDGETGKVWHAPGCPNRYTEPKADGDPGPEGP